MLFLAINGLLPPAMAKHLPVMPREALELLAPCPGEHFLDCTFGAGGHTRELLESAADVRVTALDMDPLAAREAEAVTGHGNRFRFYRMNFARLGELKEGGFNGVLMDLGVSSMQLDTAERGFSCRRSGPADMRFDPGEGVPAAEFLETAPRADLVRAVRDYGEEPRWRQVVGAILRERGTGVLEDSGSLAGRVAKAAGRRRGKRHPAVRVFQGIRIFINRELENLEKGLPEAFAKLAEGGRLVVISFHSLEDRAVKRFFRRAAGLPEHAGDAVPKQWRVRRARILTPRPLRPSEQEIRGNPRARSARLRALVKESSA